MNKRNFIIITIVIVLFFIAGYLVVSKYMVKGDGSLISPGAGKTQRQAAVEPASSSLPVPQTPAYNPPPETHYNSSTDLKQELDSINPQVLDSDFE